MSIPYSMVGKGLSGIALPIARRVSPGLFSLKTCAVQPMPTPAGIAYALRGLYGLCAICHRTHKRKNKIVDINLVWYKDEEDVPAFTETFNICDACYLKTIKECKEIFRNMEDWPLFINDKNMFIKHFIEKSFKEYAGVV